MKNTVLFVTSLAIILAVLEVYLRTFDPQRLRLSRPDDLLTDTVYRTPPWPPEWEQSWRVTGTLLREMKNISNNSGAEFVLFSVTRAIQVDDMLFRELAESHPNLPLDYDNLDKRLATFAAMEDIAFVPSLPAVRWPLVPRCAPASCRITG